MIEDAPRSSRQSVAVGSQSLSPTVAGSPAAVGATERARELLAAEYDRAERPAAALHCRTADTLHTHKAIAVRAIAAAIELGRSDVRTATAAATKFAALSAPQAEIADREAIARIVWEWAIGRGSDCSFEDAPTSLRDRCNHIADKVAALRSSASSPVAAGMVLVPLEPTNAMVIAGGMANAPNIVDCPDDAPEAEVQMRDHCLQEAWQCWSAMIAAAPGTTPIDRGATATLNGGDER